MKKRVLSIIGVMLLSFISISGFPKEAQAGHKFNVNSLLNGFSRSWQSWEREQTRRKRDQLQFKRELARLEIARIRAENRTLERRLIEFQRTNRERLRQNARLGGQLMALCQKGNSAAVRLPDGRPANIVCQTERESIIKSSARSSSWQPAIRRF